MDFWTDFTTGVVVGFVLSVVVSFGILLFFHGLDREEEER
jgi:hypothetical protein